MTRKTSAICAVILICIIMEVITYSIGRGYFEIVEIIGALFGLLIVPFVISCVTGFISGAIRENSFNITFYWTYISSIIIITFTSMFHVFNITKSTISNYFLSILDHNALPIIAITFVIIHAILLKIKK